MPSLRDVAEATDAPQHTFAQLMLQLIGNILTKDKRIADIQIDDNSVDPGFAASPSMTAYGVGNSKPAPPEGSLRPFSEATAAAPIAVFSCEASAFFS